MNWWKWIILWFVISATLGITIMKVMQKPHVHPENVNVIQLQTGTLIHTAAEAELYAYDKAEKNYFELWVDGVPLQSVWNVENNRYELRVTLSPDKSYLVSRSNDNTVEFRINSAVTTQWDKNTISNTWIPIAVAVWVLVGGLGSLVFALEF